MAKSISEEEIQLRKRARRRLIGAIALVTIVVVFLPMVLDHEPKPVSQDITIQIPSPGSSTFTSKIVPAAPLSQDAKDSKAAEPAPVARPDTANVLQGYDSEAAPPKSTPEKARPAVKPAPAEPAKTTARTAALLPKAPAEVKGTTYVVQVAALNDVNKAKEMQQKIAGAGIKSYTEVVPTAKGNVTRVRAGPFATRDEAEKMRDRLKAMGLTGNIVPK